MTDIERALVIGATGNVGRPAVAGLVARGVMVRGLARDPSGLPPGVAPVAADVRDAAALRSAAAEVDAVLLVWPFMTADGIDEVADALGRPGRRVAYVSALQTNGVWGEVEDAVRRTGADWTFLRASGFAANTLQWAEAIRAGRPVRAPSLGARRSLIHERDIADVAVVALTEPGHAGRAYALTGPAAITQAEQVRLIGEAAGVAVTAQESTRAQARAEMLGWAGPAFADAALDYWASLVDTPEPVTDTVREVTGAPARSFAQWARDHAGAFTPGTGPGR